MHVYIALSIQMKSRNNDRVKCEVHTILYTVNNNNTSHNNS